MQRALHTADYGARPSVAVGDPRRLGVLLETEEPAPPRASRFACINGGCLGNVSLVSRLLWRFYLRDARGKSGDDAAMFSQLFGSGVEVLLQAAHPVPELVYQLVT